MSDFVKRRSKEHGNPYKGHKNLGIVWRGILQEHFQVDLSDIPAHVVALMLSALKINRAVRPFNFNEDDYVDLLGYGEIGFDCAKFDEVKKMSQNPLTRRIGSVIRAKRVNFDDIPPEIQNILRNHFGETDIKIINFDEHKDPNNDPLVDNASRVNVPINEKKEKVCPTCGGDVVNPVLINDQCLNCGYRTKERIKKDEHNCKARKIEIQKNDNEKLTSKKKPEGYEDGDFLLTDLEFVEDDKDDKK